MRYIHGEEEKCTQHFGGDACRKDTISKTRHTWKVNITMDLKEIQGSSPERKDRLAIKKYKQNKI
jgi:hypothetical protein